MLHALCDNRELQSSIEQWWPPQPVPAEGQVGHMLSQAEWEWLETDTANEDSTFLGELCPQ